MEYLGDQEDLLPGVRNPAGFDLFPLRHGQAGQRGEFLERPAVPPAGDLDKLAEALGTGFRPGGGGTADGM